MKGVKMLVYDQVEQKGYSLLKEAEDLLRKSGKSNELYIEKVNAIYRDHTCDLNKLNDNYIEILGRTGRIYSDMCNLNILSGIRDKNSTEYDHYLVYCIAGWMKDHLLLSCLDGKNQKEITRDITNYILDYLKNKQFIFKLSNQGLRTQKSNRLSQTKFLRADFWWYTYRKRAEGP